MTYETPQEKVDRLYRESMDEAAVRRQDAAAEARFPCCWEHFEIGHHPLCRHAPEPEGPPPLIEGQGTFA